MTNTDIVGLCRDCARSIYGTRPPSEAYAESVARLLAGTAAAESALRAARQGGYSWTSDAGAWGLWQTEWPAVFDNVEYLRRRADVRANALRWLYGTDSTAVEWDTLRIARPVDLCRALAVWPRLGCLMARIHYMRFPDPVPADLGGQADYWKRLYNTRLGAGTRDQYVSEYLRLIAPALG